MSNDEPDFDTSLPQLRKALRQELPLLAEKYHVHSLGLFGSYVREEQRPDSDLDILVSFRQPPSLLRFVELEDHLAKVLGVKVDLVAKNALRKRIGERILSEVIPL